jgi:hypothetical protein
VGDGDGVDVVELAVVDVALGQLGVVEGEEVGEEGVLGLAQTGELSEAAEGLGHLWMHVHCRQPPRPDAVVENTVRAWTIAPDR